MRLHCGWTITSGFASKKYRPAVCCRNLHLWSASTSSPVLPDTSTGKKIIDYANLNRKNVAVGSAAYAAQALPAGTGDRVGHRASMELRILMDTKQISARTLTPASRSDRHVRVVEGSTEDQIDHEYYV